MNDQFRGLLLLKEVSTDLSVETSRQLSRILFSESGAISWPHSRNVLNLVPQARTENEMTTLRLVLTTGTYVVRISAGESPTIIYCRVSDINATYRERLRTPPQTRGIRYCDGKPVAIRLRRECTPQEWKAGVRESALQLS